MNDELLSCQTGVLINAIIFDLLDTEYSDKGMVFDLSFMTSFLNVVKYHVENGNFSEVIKDNIRKYLFQARAYEDADRDKRIDIVNEIIVTLNSQKEDNSLGFYRYELYKRRRNFRYAISLDEDALKKEIDILLAPAPSKETPAMKNTKP